MAGNAQKKEFGDYQTPEAFAETVCRLLRDKRLTEPEVIIEPTVGVGNFLQSALRIFPDAKRFYGIEINPEYCAACRERFSDPRVEIRNGNFFTCEIEKLLGGGETLFIGNPPWATNAGLSHNLPEKRNYKHLSGLDAITGASNFDICEAMIWRILERSAGKNVSVAMLCKTSVARNILMEIGRTQMAVTCAEMYLFDERKVFGVSASACLFFIRMSSEGGELCFCEVYDMNRPHEVRERLRIENGMLRTERLGCTGLDDFDGGSGIVWRQGVKHDCASVMELERTAGDCVDASKSKRVFGDSAAVPKLEREAGDSAAMSKLERICGEDGWGIGSQREGGLSIYTNKRGENVQLEDTYVFPLVKSSDFKKPVISSDFSKYVIVTQKKVRESTDGIRQTAPFTWEYLCRNKPLFDARKSSIYRDAPAFSMFGVGEYSYAKYKVGVSGFYKKPLFSLLYNEADLPRPVMLDDTAYFLPFDDYASAYICMLLLNSRRVQDFLTAIAFSDAKRPYTKRVLGRLNLKKCMERISFAELAETEALLGLQAEATEEMYTNVAIRGEV